MEYTEEQVDMIIELTVGWCEREYGNGLEPPTDAIKDGVINNRDELPDSYGYRGTCTVDKWEVDFEGKEG